MRTKLTRIGNEVALVLDETMLDQLGVDETTEVDVSINGDEITVKRLQPGDRERRFRDAAEKIADKHAGLFKRLAE